MKKNIKLLGIPTLLLAFFSLSINLFDNFFISNQKENNYQIEEKEERSTYSHITDFEILGTESDGVYFHYWISDDDPNYVPPDEIGVNFVDGSHATASLNSTDYGYRYYISTIAGGLKAGETYVFYSLTGTGLSTVSNPDVIANEIALDSPNINSNTGLLFYANNKSYLIRNTFSVDGIDETGIDFSFKYVQSSTQVLPPENKDIEIYEKDDPSIENYYYVDDTVSTNHISRDLFLITGRINNAFEIEKEYVFSSLNGFNLGIYPGGDSYERINFESDLGMSEDDLTFAVPGSAYIEENYFSITDIERESVQFQLKVHQNYDSSYDITQDLNIVLADGQGEEETHIATFVEQDEQDISTYQISDLLFGIDYTFLRIEQSPFALSDPTAEINQSISFIDDLLILDSDLEFNTIGNVFLEQSYFEITDFGSDFVQFKLKINNSYNLDLDLTQDLNVILKDENESQQSYTASFVEQDEEENINTYEINGLAFGIDYTFVSIEDSPYSVASPSSEVDTSISFTGDLLIEENNLMFHTIGNAYIEEAYFNILNVEKDSVQFQIKIENDINSEVDLTQDLNVILKDENESQQSYTASFVEQDEEENINTYEINGLAFGIDYTFVSIEDSPYSVGTPTNDVDTSISFTGDLLIEENNLMFHTIGNAYMEQNYFNILNVEKDSVQFQIKVENDINSEADLTQDLNVILKDENESQQSYTASFVEQDEEENINTYQINGLAFGIDYAFVSIEDSPYSVASPSSEVDTSISFTDDLSILEEDLMFHTIGNSYIEVGAFKLLEDTITNTTINFSLDVNQIEGDDFNPGKNINVTLENLDEDETFSTIAFPDNNISKEKNTYIYTISGLESNVNYQVLSLDDSNLALNSETNEKTDDISVVDDLGYNETFITDTNPYTESDGFKIEENSITKTSFEFSLIVNNWENSKEILTIGIMEGENQEVNYFEATLINQDNNIYRYKVDGLEEGHSYTLYSIEDPGFALAPGEDIETEIVLGDYLDSDTLTFSTKANLELLIIILIVLIIVLLLIIILLYVYIKRRRKMQLIKSTLQGEEDY